MRTVILLSAILIASAINPKADISDKTGKFVAFMFIVSMIMDIIELFK